jgi:hypothetical protein
MLQVVKSNVTELESWVPDPASPRVKQEGLGKPACHWELGCYQAWKHPADFPAEYS